MSVFTAVGVTTATGSETQSKISVGSAGQIFTSNGTSSLPAFKGNLSVTNGTTYFDGTTLATTAVGTANQVLTSNGASAPTYQAGPAWRLIETKTGSGVAAIDFTSIASSGLLVEISGLTTGAAGRSAVIQVSTDNGSSWINTNYASAANSFGTTISTATYTNTNASTYFILNQSALSTSAGRAFTGSIRFNLFNAASQLHMYGTTTQTVSVASNVAVNHIYGVYQGTTARNAMRFMLDDGSSKFSATISLYKLVT